MNEMHSSMSQGGSGASWPSYVAALLLVTLYTAASYPGFMSYDSVEALRQARQGVEGSQYPPFGSYIWRLLDWVWPGPTLMQLFQNGLLVFSFAYVLQKIRWPVVTQIAGIVIFVFLPPIAGTMLVVWKDVAVAAFYLSSFAILFSVDVDTEDRKRRIAIGVALVLLFCGMAFRFNAASGAWPIAIYASTKILKVKRGFGEYRNALTLGSAILLVFFSMVWIVNSYRFPGFELLQKNTNMDSIMRYDLVGISAFSGDSFVQRDNGTEIDAAYMKKIYDPRHLNMTAANDKEQLMPAVIENLPSVWTNAIKKHPVAYLKHRAKVFGEYISLHRHNVFYVTHPTVDKNDLGIVHTPTKLTDNFVQYVVGFQGNFLMRPWFYYILGLFMLAGMFLLRVAVYRLEAVVVFSSGLLYLAPMYFIAPAGDLRYNFWSICGALVAVLLSVTGCLCYRDNARGLNS